MSNEHAEENAVNQLTFPILPKADILTLLEEISMPMTAKDLEQPTPEIVWTLYEGFVELLTGFRRDENATAQTIEGLIPFAELHRQSVSMLGFYKNLNKLMQAVGVHDFSVHDDLFTPDRKRLQRNLSALINFLKFREEKYEAYTQLTQRTDQLQEQKQELEERYILDQQRLQALREQQKQQEPQVLALTEECAQLEKEVQSLNIKQASLTANVQRMKSERADLSAGIESNKAQIAACEADIAIVRAAIVENPAALEGAIHDMRAAVEHENRAIFKIEEESEALAAKVKVLTDLQGDLKESNQLLRECVEEEKRNKVVEAELKELRGAIESVEVQLQQLDTNRDHLDRQLKSVVDKMSRVSKQQKKKEKEAERDLEKANQERIKAESEVAQNENKVSENTKVVERMHAKLLDMQAAHVSEMEKLKEHYMALENQVRQYHRELSEIIRQ